MSLRAHQADVGIYFSRADPRIAAVAHRGGFDEGSDDNSLRALMRAAELGFRYAEIDVRATEDRQLVLWHGKGLERLRPDRLLDAAGVEERGHGAPVALREVIRRLPDDTCFFLDLKNDGAADLLASVVDNADLASRVCVGSFSHKRTMAAAASIQQQVGVTVKKTMTPRQFARLGIEALLHTDAREMHWDSAQIPIWAATRRVIQKAHDAGKVVIAWTVNSEAEMHALLDRGADGVMTDDLELAKLVLQTRGAWWQ